LSTGRRCVSITKFFLVKCPWVSRRSRRCASPGC